MSAKGAKCYTLLMSECPCGSGKALAACCDPYITGQVLAPTAEALMRARYTSYATGRVDFVGTSHAPESRGDFNRENALMTDSVEAPPVLRTIIRLLGRPSVSTALACTW